MTTLEIKVTVNEKYRSVDVEVFRDGELSYMHSFHLSAERLARGGIGGALYQLHEKVKKLLMIWAEYWGGEIKEPRHPGLAKPE